jgi:hypothetical protein
MSAFFEPGRTYAENKPFAAPEVLQLFHCVAVAVNPRDGGVRAFGFGSTAAGSAWYSTALRQATWDAGWVEVETAEEFLEGDSPDSSTPAGGAS